MIQGLFIIRGKRMGLLGDIFKRFKGEEETIEFPEEETEAGEKIVVRIETLKDFLDTERVARMLKQGNIVFLKTATLQRQDLGEFKNCVEKLKRFCHQYNWDIAGMEEGYLILAPTFVRIER